MEKGRVVRGAPAVVASRFPPRVPIPIAPDVRPGTAAPGVLPAPLPIWESRLTVPLPLWHLLALRSQDAPTAVPRGPVVELYADLAPAPTPDREYPPGPDRIPVYAARESAGYAIFHPGDLERRELSATTTQRVHHHPNGEDLEGDWIVQGTGDPEPDELRDELLADLFSRSWRRHG